MLFDPRLIFVIIWMTQIIGHIFSGAVFNSLNAVTWAIIVITISSFLFGSHITLNTGLITKVIRQPANIDTSSSYIRWLTKVGPFLAGVYLLTTIYVFYWMLVQFKITGFSAKTYEFLRLALINDFAGERKIASFLKVFFGGVGLSVYLTCYADKFSRLSRIIVLSTGFVSAVLTTGRLSLLLFFLAISFIYYRKQLVGRKGLLLFLLLFIIVFLTLAIIFNKGSGSASDSLIDQLIWNIMVYFLGGVSTLDHYIAYGIPVIDGGALLPNFVRTMLYPLAGEIPLKPSVYPFVSNPLASNTYTALFPVYHDLGVIGLVTFFFGLGAIHQAIYIKQKYEPKSGFIVYIYSLSLYPLVMTIFEEAYISSPGFWLTFLLIPTFIYLLYLINLLFLKPLINILTLRHT